MLHHLSHRPATELDLRRAMQVVTGHLERAAQGHPATHLPHPRDETVIDDPQPTFHRGQRPSLGRPVHRARVTQTPVNRLVRRRLFALVLQAAGPRGKKPPALPAGG